MLFTNYKDPCKRYVLATSAKRLELILPKLIQCSQNAYVKGRSTFAKMSGILVAIDFKKA